VHLIVGALFLVQVPAALAQAPEQKKRNAERVHHWSISIIDWAKRSVNDTANANNKKTNERITGGGKRERERERERENAAVIYH
jgi:hypothetical protein